MALNTALKDAAGVLAERINGGQGAARTNLGGDGTAFGWAIMTVADYATTATASGMDFKHTLVTESGTSVAIVGPGGTKPTASTLTSGTTALKKHAGMGVWNLEQAIDAVGLAGAIGSVLQRSVLKSFEADAIGILDTGAGDTVTGADWVAATANAQASVIAAGGSPSVLVLSAADYGDFVGDVTNVNAFSQSPDSPVGALLGTPIHVSSGLATGKAFLFDSSAVVCVQQEDSPLVTVDAVSLAGSNEARLVIDLIAGTLISDAALVVEITAPV